VLLPLIMIFASSDGGALFGWAKPTPVGAHNFRRLARGHMLVAGAGPGSNMMLALLFTIGLIVAFHLRMLSDGSLVTYLLIRGVEINVLLAVFNLIPVPPLDGSWIASWGLPRGAAQTYDRIMEPYGFLILFALFVTPVLGWIIGPPIRLIETFLFGLVR